MKKLRVVFAIAALISAVDNFVAYSQCNGTCSMAVVECPRGGTKCSGSGSQCGSSTSCNGGQTGPGL